MNIARLINFNSCDGVAYSEIQLKAITPTIATSEPFPLSTLSSPAQWAFCLAVCSLWAKGKEDVNAPHTFGLMCQVFFCVFSSVCLYRRPHNLLHSRTDWGDKLFTNSLHAHGQFKLCTSHAAAAANDTRPPLNPCLKPCLNSHQSAHSLLIPRVFSGRHYAANRTQLCWF